MGEYLLKTLFCLPRQPATYYYTIDLKSRIAAFFIWLADVFLKEGCR